MNIKIDNTAIAEIASKFFDKGYDKKDIENGTVTEENNMIITRTQIR